ncbi:MAG: CHC2 zinc finger domain-containing protein [Bacteroidales bacterium]|nr:CHC2 zinc finger domain-containing protein [Bacteroidales bacterium]
MIHRLPAKGIFKCFGCGKGSNAVNFIMEHEHLFVPRGATMAGKEIPHRGGGKGGHPRGDRQAERAREHARRHPVRCAPVH